ncbi:MAG: non-ribosomal peptide synthase/polyketide synthase [Thermoanaerobaculia bacterium]|nr:non-ribosomal peptide synthase/polyketide synthase [Thermoanaerobaculia bacterium]
MNRENIEDLYRLTPIQQGVLFHTLEAAGSAVYVEQFSYALNESTPEVLELWIAAWNELLAAHPVLRTSFLWQDLDEPLQVVHKRVTFQYEMVSLEDSTADEQARIIRERQQDERRRGFDLEQPPLFRFLLLRLSPTRVHQIWTYHHLILDGWSASALLVELDTRVKAAYRGQVPRLPERRPYKDYVAFLRKQDLAEVELYWRQRLGAVSRPTPLGVDRPPSGVDEGYAFTFHWVPEAASTALATLARSRRLTLNTLIVGAWAALLGRLSGQDEVVFGQTLSGRPPALRGSEAMLGCFINTLPVRVDLEPRESLLTWLERLQREQVELRRFEGSPLVEVLGWSGVPRSQPLFESILVFENVGAKESDDSAQMKEGGAWQRTNYPLTIVAMPGTRIVFRVGFERARFDEATVRRLLGHLETLLTTLPAMVAAAGRLADWPLLSAAEERTVLAAGARRAEFPGEDTLASRFANQVAARPAAPAVSFEGETWTYTELDRRARRLAHRLRALGVGPDVRVGLVAERSLELVAGLVAIVQAGGAYVPLDPASPPERLAFQIADSGAAAILVQPGLEGRLGVPGGALVMLDSSGDDDPPPLANELAADHLAYVIYTSGSTGLPKGSLLTQRNVLRLFDATAEWFDFAPKDVWTLFHSYAFDFSVWEMWGALLYGGRLVVVPYWVSRAPESFHELLAREGVTVLNQTPSAFRQLVAADLERPASDLARLRSVIFGGEALEPTALAPWYERHGESATLVNMYGITETTVHVTYRPLQPADAAVAGASPVGVPIPDLEIFLLDRLGRPVPVGVAGEIHVGGAGLARGYLGRPGLTAERFVPSPFGPPGARLYRSGDLARRRPFDEGGELEFLGRIDHQVKIRGFRIELGEIEAALLAHPAVSQAAVVVREDGGDRRLVAYVVAAPGATVSAAELKAHAGSRLNDYMVPAAIVELPALPLTVNGKLDRAALPAPDLAPAGDGVREAPRGAIEETVAAVWSEVLGVPVTSRHDDFFALGGHSLLATKVLSRLKQRLGVTLPLRALFEAATVEETARAVAALQRGEEAAAAATPIRRLPRGGPLPLSFGQERLWFLDRLEPGSATYNVPFALRLEGALDRERLSQALAGVFARHEALRTSFAEGADGAPVQVVAETVVPELSVIDLSDLAPAERDLAAAEIAGREAARGFDLERGPLARFVLLRLAERSHAALWTAHHIVSDGWSTGVFLADLAALYQGATLPALAIQPADFAAWQRTHLDLEAQLRFWREALAGAPTFLPLPTDRPRPPVMTYRGRAVPFRLPEATSEAVRALAAKSGATPFMVVLAAFSGLLGRHAGITDLLVGSPSAGRRRLETENLVGFFVNTLILRADLGGAPSFAELLTRAKNATLAAYAHEDVPFEKVVEELAPARSLAHSPLFQAMLSLETGRGEGIDLGDLAIGPQRQPIRVSKFDLTLAVVDSGSGSFGGHWAFASDLFDPTTVLRLGERLATVLAAVTTEPKLPLAAWPLLTRAEQHAVAREWNDPRVEYPESGALLPELFRRRAAAHPDRVALVTDDGTVSYGELATWAGAVARQLVTRGVGPETIVAIAIERSPALVAGLLGILEAGAAYLPIDPELPEERRRFLIADSGAALVLTAADLAVATPSTEPLPPVGLEPGHPAYVIYTSGSTGVPKGVVVSHSALINRLLFALENDVDADSVFLQKTTASFDVSLLEIFAPLLAGGRTVLAKPGGAADPEYLLRRIAEAEVTHTSFPPTLLGELLAAGRLRELPSLKSVVTGGEVVPVELVGRFFGKDTKDTNDTNDENDKNDGDAPSEVVFVPGVLGVLSSSFPALFNRYGPTEATISVTSWTCRAQPAERVLPIGRPTAKAEIHLLDRAGRPVPVGVPGELHVGGPPVARGYLRRPGKTAEVFVPDEFSGRPGARLYKTGDLARYRPDGALEFVGRIDNQVKIRGFRVELGEIEAALLRHEAVREAAVVDWGEGNAKTLAAYLVATNGHGPTEGDLRSLLGTSLPPHMVPSSYQWLEQLPLTPSGKVDRRALPAPGVGPAAADEPPVGATEQRLAAIWSEVLGLDAVGRHGDFFALGGHSLLATRVVSRVRAAFGVELPLRALFEEPTVAGLAREIDRLVAAERGAGDRPPLVATPREGELPLSFAQERLWFLEQLDGGRGTYNLSVAVRLGGVLEPARLERALGEVVARHESLRTTFHTGPTGAPEQRIATALAVPVRRDDSLLGFTGDLEAAVAKYAATEADEPFDLSAGPLLRARLLALGADDHVFLLTVHHLVSDGWSTQVLLREVVHGYRSSTPLPPLPVQYVDFARWQRTWLTGDELDRQLGYWRQVLVGAPPVLDLPLDHPRPPVAGAQGRRQPVQLTGPWQGRLSELLAATGTTPFMALLAVWGAFLGRLAGVDRVVVGAPVANRNQPEIEGLVGFFVNTLALPVDLSGAPSFGDLLARVRQVTLGAYDHQDLPFEKLVAELAPARSRSHSPIFQVMLVLQNAAAPSVEAAAAEPGGLTLRTLLPAGSTTKFDLTLALSETTDGFSGFLGSKTELFEATTTARWAASLGRFLAAALAHPERPVAALPWLSVAEEHQLRHEWNDTARDFRPVTVTELVAAWAVATPDAVAVVDPEGRPFTYRELLARADALAAVLQERGAGPETVVAVAFERGIEQVVALLGVLRSGAAYLPLEIAHPDERLAELLADAVPLAVVASATQARRFPGALGLPDGDGHALAMATPEPDSLAYLIYTSGSTGKPKAVAVPHGALAERLAMMVELFTFAPGDRQLQFVSVAFDMAVEEIFVTLGAGATLVLAPSAAVKKPSDLLAFAARHGVTKMNLPASLWHQIAEDVAAGTVTLPATLRILVTGAEAASPNQFATLLRAAPAGLAAFNLYGPTETTIIAAGTRLPAADELARRSAVPLGRPLPAARLAVVDAGLRRVPIGVAGELLIAGDGMARGYLGRPGLTAERFVPDADSEISGARAYRTGDRVRVAADGTLEFLGRLDEQVKIRGFRIELGEIEEHLRRHPAVAEAAVAARGERLVAYLVAESGQAVPNVTALRAFLAERLPEALVPAAFLTLPALPRNASGKVDRRALPAPDAARPELAGAYQAPETELERFLVELVAEVVGVERAGVLDNFFDLGGDSLKGAVLVNRLEQALGEYVYVTALFDTANLRELATYLTKHYPRSVAARFGTVVAAGEEQAARVTPERAMRLRAVVTPLPPYVAPAGQVRNPPAVFLLSPPRSGSTLLRVLLAGHPGIFAPPEVDLLSFDTLAERRAAFSGRYAFWLEGLVRAVMASDGCDAATAEARLAELEGRGATVAEAYGWLQGRLGGRLLVDKTPSYALDAQVLARAEALFDRPKYVHLLRHPYGMIRSFEEARLDQTFFRHDHPFTRKELAELVWLVSQENILAHLASIEPERHTVVRFEDLVADPRPELERLSAFLGLEFDPEMLEPYKERERRMTDGIHPLAKMLGDVKFHEHQGIDRGVADRWREAYPEDFLGDVTWAMAERLGYEPPRRRRPIVPATAAQLADLPLSFAQERLWFLSRLVTGTSLHHLASAVRLRGELDWAALERALGGLVARHPGLRTTFEDTPDGPRQRIAAPAAFRLERSPVEGEEGLRSAVQAFVRSPFDLERGPLFRAAVFVVAPAEHVIVLAMHHIVSDGWSMGLLVRDLGVLYRAALGAAPALPPATLGYPDFTVWQRTAFGAGELAAQLDFWSRELADQPPLELPADRPGTRSYQAGVVPFRLDGSTSTRLLELARRERVSLFHLLVAGLDAFLMRLTGADDVTVGTVVAGRSRRETEDMVGFFVNTVALRGRPLPELAFREFLATTKRAVLAAFEHQDVPFERVVDALQPQRQLGRPALFSVLLALQEVPAAPAELGAGVRLEPYELATSAAEVDLAFTAFESGGRIGGRVVFDRGAFDETTARRLVRVFETVLAGAVSAPETTLGRLPVLTPSERHRLLVEANDTSRGLATGTLHGLVLRWAVATPDAPALEFEPEDGSPLRRLSYAQLELEARRVALRLVRLGAGPEVPVVTSFPHGVEAIVAFLGVLMAGAVHVPVDPASPPDRRAFVLADSGARLVLTTAELAERFGPETTILTLPLLPGAAAEEFGERKQFERAWPESAAYRIYTSGTSGQPKGVVIEHRSAVSYLQNEIVGRHLGPGDRALQFAAYGFDASVDEIFLGLASGATVVVRNGSLLGSAERYLGAVRRWQVTYLLLPTALFNQFALELDRVGPLPDLRCLAFGGERVFADRLRTWIAAYPGIRFVNLYGPTEATVATTRWNVPGDGEALVEPVPIGLSVGDSTAYVLDAGGEPVPFGVSGELVVGGAGLARGYGGAPSLTADRFRPDPFGVSPGARVYRTGDRVCRDVLGRLVYLGRVDQQVKIRGHRIELGEVEAALAALPAVLEAAVAVHERTPGDRQLVAHVVAVAGSAVSATSLRAALASSLPEAMLPAAFVFHDALPKNSSDKIDRRALPAPTAVEAVAEGAEAAPLGLTEELLAAIWRELLGVESIGRNDQFFALGGHSLLATRVLSRVRTRFGVEPPLAALFAAPTLAGFARVIEAERRRETVADEPELARVTTPDQPAQASFGQARMWFLDRLLPDRAGQNLPISLRLRGPLDVAAFERAAVALEAHHESLRTVFAAGPTGPLQLQRPPGSLTLEQVDLTDLPLAEREARAQEIVQAAAQVPFDLATGPLVRWLLVRTGPEVHRLAVVMHHIVADGWSIDLLIRDLAQLYRAARTGEPLELPAPALRYADFAVWQRAWFASPAARQDEDYWRTALAGVPTRLPLPTDRPRPTQVRGRGRTIVGELPAATTAELDRRATAWGATPFLVLLAAYGAVLGRLAGEDDLVVGTPVAGRTRSELEGIVGLFLNTLPLRARVALEGSFADHLALLTQSTLDAFAHQNLPFEHLLEVLEVPRSLAHAPLFQVFLVLQNLPTGERPAADLAIEPVPLAGVSAPFDLTLAAAPRGDRLTLAWTFDTDLFDDVTIERLAARFTALLTAALAEPERRLADLPWLLPGEEAELRRFGLESRAVGTRVVAPAATTLHGLVVAQAERDSAATALAGRTLAGEWEELDYGELVRRARELARRLVEDGVASEERVVICLPRSVEMIVAVLAVLAAGGAYVPLDPAWPVERKRFVLADAGARRVIAVPASADDWGAARVVTPQWDVSASGASLPAVGPRQAAYVIYTSGSTGQPKGVVVEHRAAVAYVTAEAAALGHGPGDRSLQFASLAFDASIDEIFDSLASGATLVLLDDEGLGSGPEFFGFIERHRVTVAGVPTAYWHVLAQGFPAVPPALRLVSFGGERALAEAYAAWRGWLPATVRLANAYGPTEAVIAATRWEADGAGSEGDPPIGRPVGGVRAYVLDAAGRPVPPGVPGELCLGGEGLARGYLGLPASTAGRFLPDPWAEIPGGRYYRTGDAVRWTPEGELQYLGRLDFQVKLRGFRIELEEIEAVLGRHPAVREAIVVVHHPGQADAALVAYWTRRPEAPENNEELADLRRHLRAGLPEYMVPAHLVLLPEFPRGSSDKVDRARLPAPEWVAGAGRPPRTNLEVRLLELWRRRLGVLDLGVEDDFFSTGGNSIQAALLSNEIREQLGFEVPVARLFEAPTVAALAARLELLGVVTEGATEPEEFAGRWPASFAQERLWFLEQLERVGSAYHLSLALELRGRLDREALARALDALVERHEALRTAFQPTDQGPVLVVDDAVRIALPVIDLSSLPSSAAEAAARQAAAALFGQPFDLASAPLGRAVLIAREADVHELHLVFHHIIADGWSVGLIADELSAFYGAATGGPPPTLRPLPMTHREAVRSQRRRLSGDRWDSEVAFWRQRLANLPALALATDRPRPALQTFRGDVVALQLPTAVSAGLGELARKTGATPFMVLAAAFSALLARFSGQDDFALGTPVANRDRTELEGLVGLFLNTLVIRFELAGEPSFRTLLEHARERVIEAFGHQDLPFERVLAASGAPRDLTRTPLFQVFLTLQNLGATRSPELPGLDVRALPTRHDTAKFDLAPTFVERPEGFGGALEYNLDLFDRTTAERWARSFGALVAHAVAHPETPLGDLPILDPAEWTQIVAWNATAADYPAVPCAARVAAVARVRPSAVAVADAARSLTYRELDAAANRLAHRLRDLGLAPEARVGLALERSVDLVVAVLAVSRAGAAYVPVDPSHPAERIAFVLADAEVGALVGDERTLSAVAGLAPAGTPLVRVDDPSLRDEPAGPPFDGPALDDLAYVLYTSGSTGRPKGVAVSHRAFANFLHALGERLTVGPDDTVVAVTTLAFDISGLELLLPLVHGGRVFVAQRADTQDGERLAKLLATSQATLFQATPATWSLLAAGEWRPARPLRGLIGGEAVPRDLADRLLERGVRLWNVYGPTETTVWSAATPIEPGAGPVPVGGAIDNTELQVVDRAGRPVPLGVVGELVIGGVGLARGYRRRPGLTAERFVPDPFSGRAGARLYRTGDLVRRRVDGRFDFLGRLDFQVKLRGFRIELGEIETALESHPAIARAVVVLRRDPGAEEGRLLAYVAAAEGPAPEVETLRVHLGKTLPGYMVPSGFVVLSEFPLNASGKVDRPALPAPEVLEVAARAPRTPLEALVLERFRAALPAGAVLGVESDFFSAGGTSLGAALLVQRLAADLGAAVPVVTVFERATPAAFAAWLAAEYPQAAERLISGEVGATAESRSVVTLRSGDPAMPPLWLVHPMSGEVSFYRHLVEALAERHPDLPVLGFEAPGLAGGDAADSIAQLAAGYVATLERLAPTGPIQLAGSSLGGAIVWEMACQLAARGRQPKRVVLVDTMHPRELGPEFSALPAAAVLGSYFTGRSAAELAGEFADRSEAEVAAKLLALAHGAGLPASFDGAALDRVVAVLQANRRAYAAYSPASYPGPVRFLRARLGGPEPPLDTAWHPLATAGLEVVDLPGNHLSMHRPPHVAALAAVLVAGAEAVVSED